MPNWCSTTYEIRGEAADLLKIENAITAAEGENQKSRHAYYRRRRELLHGGLDEEGAALKLRDEGLRWISPAISLRHLLSSLGFPADGDTGGNCRGSVTYHYITDAPGEARLMVYCETAWCESDGFRHALEQLVPGIEIYYTAVEPGCEVYCTNDPDIAGQVNVELGGIPGDVEGISGRFEDEEQALEAISEVAGKPLGTVKEAREWVLSQGDDAYLSYGVFGYYDD